jgi:hypothetical protein
VGGIGLILWVANRKRGGKDGGEVLVQGSCEGSSRCESWCWYVIKRHEQMCTVLIACDSE